MVLGIVIGWVGNRCKQTDGEVDVVYHGSYLDADEMTDTGMTYSELTAYLAAEKEEYGQ